MSWIDPGEFAHGGWTREELRAEREQAMLNDLLAAGWSRSTAGEARRLQEAAGAAVTRWMAGAAPSACNETALGLVGEVRGQALADWWARTRDLDEQTRRLVVECAGAAAAMAMLDGYLLGRDECRGTAAVGSRPTSGAVESRPLNGARPPAVTVGAV